MKKLLAWPLSWALFWFGDLVSKTAMHCDQEQWIGFWYPVYNRSMIWSSVIQDWAGGHVPNWPWGEPQSNK